MTLLKKTLNNLAEKCGCGDDENSGTALLSFLVRRNQAEEEEQTAAVRLPLDKGPSDMGDVDPDAEEMDPDAEGEMDMDMDMGDEEMDPDAEGEMDMEFDMGDEEMDPDAEPSDPMVGDEMDPDGEMAIDNEQDPEKRLSMIQKLLSRG